MAISVIIVVFVGLVVGCASMAMWAVRRIGDKAARQFNRGFERGRWLADLTTTRGLDPAGRTRRILIVPGEPPGRATSEAHDPPPLLMPQRYRPAEPRTYARPPPPLRPGPHLA
jgi:hypothetical protein